MVNAYIMREKKKKNKDIASRIKLIGRCLNFMVDKLWPSKDTQSIRSKLHHKYCKEKGGSKIN